MAKSDVGGAAKKAAKRGALIQEKAGSAKRRVTEAEAEAKAAEQEAKNARKASTLDAVKRAAIEATKHARNAAAVLDKVKLVAAASKSALREMKKADPDDSAEQAEEAKKDVAEARQAVKDVRAAVLSAIESATTAREIFRRQLARVSKEDFQQALEEGLQNTDDAKLPNKPVASKEEESEAEEEEKDEEE